MTTSPDSRKLPEDALTYDFAMPAAEAITMLMELTGFKDEKLLADNIPSLFRLRDNPGNPSMPSKVTFQQHAGDPKDANIFGIGVYIKHDPASMNWEEWNLTYNAAIGQITSYRYRADLEKLRAFHPGIMFGG